MKRQSHPTGWLCHWIECRRQGKRFHETRELTGLFGITVAERQLDDLRISINAYSASEQLEGHIHDRPFISAVLEGSYTEVCRGVPRLCEKATVLFHPAGECHGDFFHGGPVKCLSIELHSNGAAALLRGTIPRGGFESFITLVANQIDARPALLRSAADNLLDCLRQSLPVAEGKTNADPSMGYARSLLSGTRATRGIVSETARAIGVHRAHLWRTFRKAHGEPLSRVLARARTNRAASLLIRTGKPLAEVAAECGYFDQAHFTRRFKTKVGMTPALFRERFAQRETNIQYE